MPDTFTSNILLTLMTNGEHNNTWNNVYGANDTAIDTKFGSLTSISTTGGTTTLISSQELVASIAVSGALISDSTIIFSGRGGFWNIENNTTGNFAIICKVSGQTGIILQNGESALIWCNGTDIHKLHKSPKPPTILVDGTSINVDARLNDAFFLTAGASRPLTMLNPTDQQKVIIYHKANGGSFTPTFDVSVEFGSTIASLQPTASGTTDMIGLIYSATIGKWLIGMQLQGF